MQDDIQTFTPLMADEPDKPTAPDEFADVFPSGDDDGGRLALDGLAPSIEMEELPAFDAMESLPPLDGADDAGAEPTISPIAALPDLDEDGADAADPFASLSSEETEDGAEADPFADLAMEASDETDNAEMDPLADLGEPAAFDGPAVQLQMEGADTHGRLALPEILDLDQAENLRATLLERIGTNLTIDAAAVSRIDTPCIEVAISAAKQWLDDGFALDWENPSEAFVASLDRLGLSIDFLRIEGAH